MSILKIEKGPRMSSEALSHLRRVAGFEPTTSSSRTIGSPKVERSRYWSGCVLMAVAAGGVRRCCCTSVLYSNRADLFITSLTSKIHTRPAPSADLLGGLP